MTINTPTVLAQGGTTTDGNPIATDSIAPSANRFLVAVIYSSHGTAANAVIPVSITGLGLTWSFSTRSHIEGNQRVTVATAFTGSSVPTPGPLTVDFGRTMQAMGWHILQFAAASVDTANPIVQFGYYDYATTPGANLSFNLSAATTPGNGVLAAESAGSNTITYVAGAGFTQLGDTVPLSTPSLSGAAFWSATASQTVAVGSEQAAPSKSLVAIEIKAAAGTNSPPVASLTTAKSAYTTGEVVTLDGSGTTDPDGTISAYLFTQTAGPTVALSGSGATRTFTAPSVSAPTTLTFSLRATDNTGANNTVVKSITVNQVGLFVKEKTAAGGDAFTVTPAAFTVVGGRIQIAPTDGVAAFATYTALGLTASGVRLVGSLTAYPSGATVLYSPQNTAGTRAVDIGITASGKLTIRDAANVLRATMPTAVPLNQQVTIQVIGDGSTYVSVFLYLGGSTTPLDSITYTGPAGTFSDLNTSRVGASALTPAMPMWYLDDFAIKNTDSQLGPWSGSPQPPSVTLVASKTTGAKGGEIITITAAGTPVNSTIASYSFTSPTGVQLLGNGTMRTFVVPFAPGPQILTFGVTVTDSNGLTANKSVTVNAVAHGFPNAWTLRSGVLTPIVRSIPDLGGVTVTATAAVTDSAATLSWAVAPNGRSVDGVYVGRDGTSATGYGAWESALLPLTTSSQLFSGLVNGSTYHLYVVAVVLGVRQTPVTITVTPQAQNVDTTQMIGFYHTAPSGDPDGYYHGLFGNYPMCASSYYGTGNVNETYEISRVQHGTSTFLDFDTKATPGLLASIAAWDDNGQNWVEAYMASAQRIANASNAANNGSDVYVSLCHEYEVKRNQGFWTDPSDATLSIYAKAWDNFATSAASLAPDCIPIYWTGGGDSSTIASIMALMTVPPSAVSYDPYVFAGATFQLPTVRLNVGAQFFTNNSTYQQWGSPPLYVTETAIDKAQGDTNCKNWYADLANAVQKIGLNGVIVFAVDKTDSNNVVRRLDFTSTSDPVPSAPPAFAASVTTIRNGGGGGVTIPVVIAPPVITGTAQVGAVLTTTNGSWTQAPTGYARVWKANGATIAGATGLTYTPVTGDVGKTITVTVTATNTAGPGTPSTSAPTAAIQASASTPPVIVSAPVISGTAKVGSILSVTNGTWTNSPTGYTRQWKANGVVIVGATATTYAPVTADVGKTLTVSVIASNAAGSSAAAASNATAAVQSNSQPNDGWTLIQDVDLSKKPAGTIFTDGNRGVDSSINSQSQVAWGSSGMLITAQRANASAPINSADVMMMGLHLPNHHAIEVDITLGGFLGPGMFPAFWERPNDAGTGTYAGEGERDFWEYCGAYYSTTKPANNEWKMTWIQTPYGSTTQIVDQFAPRYPDPTATTNDPTLRRQVGVKHTWRVEMIQDQATMFLDGNQIAQLKKGSWAGWGDFESPGKTWYPRFTYQVGPRTDGKGSGLGGTVPSNWLQSTYLLSRLTCWKLSSE